jgi:hypothetical protein
MQSLRVLGKDYYDARRGELECWIDEWGMGGVERGCDGGSSSSASTAHTCVDCHAMHLRCLLIEVLQKYLEEDIKTGS